MAGPITRLISKLVTMKHQVSAPQRTDESGEQALKAAYERAQAFLRERAARGEELSPSNWDIVHNDFGSVPRDTHLDSIPVPYRYAAALAEDVLGVDTAHKLKPHQWFRAYNALAAMRDGADREQIERYLHPQAPWQAPDPEAKKLIDNWLKRVDQIAAMDDDELEDELRRLIQEGTSQC